MQDGFANLMIEFGIRSNIKEEFCQFTTAIIEQALEDLDAKYQKMKGKLVERFNIKVLEQAEQIDEFSNEFCQLQKLVE